MDIIEEILMDLCEPDTGLIAIGKHDHTLVKDALIAAYEKGAQSCK